VRGGRRSAWGESRGGPAAQVGEQRVGCAGQGGQGADDKRAEQRASDAKERATRVGGGGMPREQGRGCAENVTKGSDGAVREEQETRRE
jgi:hypothetical protein